MTDIHTPWVETRVVMGKGQKGVCEALEEMRQALPFPLRGIDSDNGSEFIHHPLQGDCQDRKIQFTRGRPYKKDDNAHIEQKNWTHVRRVLGYERDDSPAALEAIQDLYRHELRLFQNFFLPSLKLPRKVRVGSRRKRLYPAPQTPWPPRWPPGSSRESSRAGEAASLARPFRALSDHSGKVGSHLATGFPLAALPKPAIHSFHSLPQKEKRTTKERENDDDG